MGVSAQSSNLVNLRFRNSRPRCHRPAPCLGAGLLPRFGGDTCRYPRREVGCLRSFDAKVRQPVEHAGQIPVPFAKQLHAGWHKDETYDGSIQECRHGTPCRRASDGVQCPTGADQPAGSGGCVAMILDEARTLTSAGVATVFLREGDDLINIALAGDVG